MASKHYPEIAKITIIDTESAYEFSVAVLDELTNVTQWLVKKAPSLTPDDQDLSTCWMVADIHRLLTIILKNPLSARTIYTPYGSDDEEMAGLVLPSCGEDCTMSIRDVIMKRLSEVSGVATLIAMASMASTSMEVDQPL